MRQMLITVGWLAAALPMSWIAANTATAPARGKEPRFPQLTLEQLNDQQRPVGEKIVKISSVGLGGPYNPMLRSPSMRSACTTCSIICAGIRRCRPSSTRWPSSSSLANGARKWNGMRMPRWRRKAGLADSIIADLKANKRPAGMSPEEEVVYDFVTDLTTKHAVSDELFDRARALLGEQQVVDLTAVAGTYVSVAMLLAMAEQGVPADKEPPFKDGEP